MAEEAPPSDTRPKKLQRSGSPLARMLLLAVAAAVILRVAFLVVSVTSLPPSGDESTNILMSKHIAGGERPLLFWGQPYQFPLEAYALAPLSRWLPRNALGARGLFFLASLAAAGLTLAAMVRVAPLSTSWPGILLVLFPSAYWLTLQSAYYIPQHTAFLFFTALLLWLAAQAEHTSGTMRAGLCAIAGLAAGVAWSAHTLILPVAFMAGTALCLGRSRREFAAGTAAFLPGLALGLAPYVIALRRHPNAFKAVSATKGVRQALSGLWDPALTSTLPSSMGVTPPLFPDFRPRIDAFAPLAEPFALIYLALLLTATVCCATGFFRRLRTQRHPSLILADACCGVSWLSLLLFAFSARSQPISYRYLLPAVVSLPFLVAFLHGSSLPVVRRAAAGLAMALVLLNILASGLLVRAWAQPGFAARVPDTPPLAPLISRLDELGVRHCYASFWQAYRITHDTDERIVCSSPYNERFYGWPLPYLAAVDKAPEPPTYVFTNTHQSRITASRFEAELASAGIAYASETVGPFRIFQSFARPDGVAERPVAGPLQGAASHNAGQAQLLVDDAPATTWASGASQSAGMWVEATLPRPIALSSVSVFFGRKRPRSIRLLLGDAERLDAFVKESPARPNWLRLDGGRLHFGEDQLSLQFPPVTARRVRVEIVDPEPGQPWEVRELLLGEPAGAP